MKTECPICMSENVRVINHKGELCVICNECGYDEREDKEEAYPEEKVNQKAKARYTPYKTGGSRRTQKKK